MAGAGNTVLDGCKGPLIVSWWEKEGEVHHSVERKITQKPASHGTFLVGVLYEITIIVVLMIVSRL